MADEIPPGSGEKADSKDAQGEHQGAQSALQVRTAFLENWDWQLINSLNRTACESGAHDLRAPFLLINSLNRTACERGRAQHGHNQKLKGPRKPDPLQNMSECILDPRHALAYFDSDHKPVGFIDVCFECWGFTTSAKISDRRPDPIDLVGLRTLFKDLKLPVFQKPEDYVKFKKKYLADR